MHLKDLERQLVKLRMENSNNHAPFTDGFPVNIANFLGPDSIVDRRKPHYMAVVNHASASRGALIRYIFFFGFCPCRYVTCKLHGDTYI